MQIMSVTMILKDQPLDMSSTLHQLQYHGAIKNNQLFTFNDESSKSNKNNANTREHIAKATYERLPLTIKRYHTPIL